MKSIFMLFYAAICNFDQNGNCNFICECIDWLNIGNVCNTESNNNYAHLNWMRFFLSKFISIYDCTQSAQMNFTRYTHFTIIFAGFVKQQHSPSPLHETNKYINGKWNFVLFLCRLSRAYLWGFPSECFICCCHCRVILIRCRREMKKFHKSIREMNGNFALLCSHSVYQLYGILLLLVLFIHELERKSGHNYWLTHITFLFNINVLMKKVT